MLLDRLMPTYDATRAEHLIVAAEQSRVYDAAMSVDFLDAVRRNRAVRAVFGVRAAVERTIGKLCARPSANAPTPDALRLSQLPESGEWISLGADRPEEVTFGVVGRFWAGETKWEQIDASEFARFDRPGFAKIACSLSFRPYGEYATLVSYEARTQATDAAAKKSFLRYWRAVAPGVGIVMRSLLKVIEQDVHEVGPPERVEA
jgi:hypothetical protein